MTKQRIKKFIVICCYIALSLLGIVTIVSGYGGVVNPATSCLPAIFAMSFPIWLMLVLLALGVTVIFDRIMAIIPGVTILICLGPILNFCPINLSKTKLTTAQEDRSFTIMSYNVYGLYDYRKPILGVSDITGLTKEGIIGTSNPTLSYILKKDPDIVCMQECHISFEPTQRIISKALLDSVNSRYHYNIYTKGIVIFSKFPLYKVNTIPLSDKTAYYVAAIAEIQGHRTLLVTAHLESIGLNSSDKALYQEITEGEGGRKALAGAKTQLLSKLSRAFITRARQVDLIRNQIDSLGVDNVIVTGDFNDIPDSYAYRQMCKDDFKSAFAMAGCGPVITYHANRFYFQIDHILYRGALDAVDYYRYGFDRSDHYPIEARFLWSENASKVDRNLKGIDLINRK